MQIIVKTYDSNWPVLFEKEKESLLKVLPKAAIEHIGSTAVPGLSAKPVIDIMASVQNLNEVNLLINLLTKQGYSYIPEIELQTPDRRFFQKQIKDGPWYHLSLTAVDSNYWTDHLLFRNYLRKHAEAAKAYEELKTRLAEKHVTDFDKYNADKAAFIRATIQKAKTKR